MVNFFRLRAAREKLEGGDVPGALAVYEEALAEEGNEPETLSAVSADLGANGHAALIPELIAPLYDPRRHGPAPGLNLLQAYLALRNPSAARHMLGLLEELKQPELDDRLRGFSGAIDRLAAQQQSNWRGVVAPVLTGQGAPAAPAAPASLVNISKPIWFYGLEPLAERILPPKEGGRRVAFAQLGLPGIYDDFAAARQRPEDEFGRLSRAIPLWLAETFYFSPTYLPTAALAVAEDSDRVRRPLLFDHEWTVDNLRQLVDASPGGLDYIFTGSLSRQAGDYELVLKVWEVKKFRERKQFAARWTPATASARLAELHGQLRLFMEWRPYDAGSGLAYAPPTEPRAWLEILGASLGLFLVGKDIMPPALLPPLDPIWPQAASLAARSPAASLAWLTLRSRARALGLDSAGPPEEAPLADDPIVAPARKICRQ